MGDTHVGLQARLMSQALRKLTGNLNRSRTICVFINQLREKIGVMFGSPETTPGGRALKFYSSVRLDIRRIESIKDGAEVTGNRTRVKVVKNKVAPPFKQAEFDIMYGKGISREGSLLDVGVDLGIVKKSGAWFTYEGEQLGQGRENAKTFLAENLDMMVEISEKIRQAVGIDDVEVDAETTTERRPTPTTTARGRRQRTPTRRADRRSPSSNGPRRPRRLAAVVARLAVRGGGPRRPAVPSGPAPDTSGGPRAELSTTSCWRLWLIVLASRRCEPNCAIGARRSCGVSPRRARRRSALYHARYAIASAARGLASTAGDRDDRRVVVREIDHAPRHRRRRVIPPPRAPRRGSRCRMNVGAECRRGRWRRAHAGARRSCCGRRHRVCARTASIQHACARTQAPSDGRPVEERRRAVACVRRGCAGRRHGECVSWRPRRGASTLVPIGRVPTSARRPARGRPPAAAWQPIAAAVDGGR